MGLALLLLPSVALATAMGIVSAAFDWTSLKLTLDGVTLSYDSQQNHTFSLVMGDRIPPGSGKIIDTTPWSNSPVVNTSNWVDGNGVGEISSSTVRAAADAFAWQPSGAKWVDAYGDASRMARFTVSGEGRITIAANYSLDLTVLGADDDGEYASVFAAALLTLYDETLDQTGKVQDYISRSVEDGSWVDPYSQNGTLTVSLPFHNGDTGQMRLEAMAKARAVPLPPTWALLVLGLACLGFSRRNHA